MTIGLNPCPFCGKSENLNRSRFSRSYILDRDTTYVAENHDDSFGSIFRITCGCGCSLTISGDILYEMMSKTIPYNKLNELSISDMTNHMWGHMAEIWNQ